MVIGTTKLLKLVKKYNFIEDLSERELENPESCVFDLRINELSVLEGEAFLGIDTRQTPEHKVIARFDNKPGNIVSLLPGEYYSTETVETINMPEDIFGIVKPRSTLFRSGIMMRAGVIDPGYKGKLHPSLFNASKINFKLEMGARYLQVFFMYIDGSIVRKYEGQWQGGRKSALISEKQI